MDVMGDYDKICDFTNLYEAHRKARLGKRNEKEVILFETDLSNQLVRLSDGLRDHSYQNRPYYQFKVFDSKERTIHALHYADRVVQHCVCDEVLGPVLEKQLIYDNAACRVGKGTHFALRRLTRFLSEYAKKHGSDGWALKCDIKKYFDHIDHDVLKQKLSRVFTDTEVYQLLCRIIDSYHTDEGKGLPLGNQSSQWFALYYLDEIDRLVKEKFQVRSYVRYMDDFVLIHEDKEFLRNCYHRIRQILEENLCLEFNNKTQLIPLKNGIDFLGFHFYLAKSGKVIRKVRLRTKVKYKRRLKEMMANYGQGRMEADEIRQVLCSYHAHLGHGHTYRLQQELMKQFFLERG